VTASEAGRPEAGAGRVWLVSAMEDAPAEVISHPMPRLGRGIVWSNIVAEIERDQEARMRDAA
jgi:hypothetical protein